MFTNLSCTTNCYTNIAEKMLATVDYIGLFVEDF